MQNPLSLVHLAQHPSRNDGPPPLLVLLHGYGSNEHDLFGLAPYLDERFLIVSARAPLAMMPGAYAWFELGFAEAGITIDLAQAEASRERIVAFIDEAVAVYGAHAGRVYMLGFSQGAIMSAAVTLTRPELVAGAVLMSGRVLGEMPPSAETLESLIDKPFLVVHGTLDTVLPIANGRASREFLSRLPVALEYHEYQMGHEVSAQSLADVNSWLRKRLDQERQ